MWAWPGAALLLFMSFAAASSRDFTKSTTLGAQRAPSKAETAFLATLRRTLNDELRSPPVLPRAPPRPAQLVVPPQPSTATQPAQGNIEDPEDEREEAEAEAEAKAARDELQQIEEQARIQASVRDGAIRNEQEALSREHAALRATAAAPVTLGTAAPAIVQQTSGSSGQIVQQSFAMQQPPLAAPAAAPAASSQQAQAAPQPQPQPQSQPPPAVATVVPIQTPGMPAQRSPASGAVVSQTSGNVSQIDSEKTAQLAANIAKVARWKEAQATQMMETARVELARVEMDSKKVAKAKEWYEQLGQRAQQFTKEAAADREAAKVERKKAEDARAAAEWEAERANGARVQAEQDWQRAQLMQKDAESAQAQVEKQQAELKKEKLEANLELKKAEEAHAKSERERAQLRLEELAFQRLRAQALAAAEAPPGSAAGATPQSSIAIAGEQVRSFGSQSPTTPPQPSMSPAMSSSQAVSQVVLDAAQEVLGPRAPYAIATLSSSVPPQPIVARQPVATPVAIPVAIAVAPGANSGQQR